MPLPDGCLSPAQLADLVHERLSAELTAQVRRHMAQCPACATAVQRLQSEREAEQTPCAATQGPAAPLPDSSTETEEYGVPEEKFDRSVLEPSENQAALGRLGKYEVLSILGVGGMGVVLRGIDTDLRRAVAIKLLNRQLSSSPVARRRFLREARAAAAINHANVVTIFSVEEFSNSPLIVMELVSGCTLRERLQQTGRLGPLEILRISAQVAAGLAAAHAQGVIHRDVKPGNILLEEQLERVKLTDFGVARAATDNVDLTSHGLAVGTPGYMAPEQVRGQAVDARADLFGLGCAMYAMVAGHSPFHGHNSWAIAQRVVDFEPPPLHELDPAVPRFLADIVQRLLRKNPDERFQSAAEVMDLLYRHLAALHQTPSDQIQVALHAGAALPKARRSLPLRWPMIVVGLLLLLGLGAAGVRYWPRLDQPPATPAATTLPTAVTPPAAATPPPATTPPATSYLITVAKQGPADVTTITEALQRARPGSQIRVLDDAVYEESVGFDQNEHFAGVSLISEAGATLSPPAAGAFALVGIKNTRDVTVSGFRIRPAATQHGVAVLGHCPGTRLTSCHIATEAAEHYALMFVTEQAGGSAEHPIVIEDSTFVASGLGLIIQGEETGWAAQHIRVRANRFQGAGQHVQLNRSVQDIELTGNVFLHGTAVRCSLNAAPASDAQLTNNTFWSNDCWLAVGAALPAQTSLVVRNNLIVKAKCLQADDETLRVFTRSGSWSHNLWEPAAGNDAAVTAVAQSASRLDFVSTDPVDADFARPTAGSPAATAGAGGELPRYVGAVPPRQSP